MRKNGKSTKFGNRFKEYFLSQGYSRIVYVWSIRHRYLCRQTCMGIGGWNC
jgi:hypothetical protein